MPYNGDDQQECKDLSNESSAQGSRIIAQVIFEAALQSRSPSPTGRGTPRNARLGEGRHESSWFLAGPHPVGPFLMLRPVGLALRGPTSLSRRLPEGEGERASELTRQIRVSLDRRVLQILDSLRYLGELS